MVSPSLRVASLFGRPMRAVLASALVGSLMLGIPSVGADSEGGQAGTYTGPEESVNLCTGWAPPIVNVSTLSGRSQVVSAIAVHNPTTSTQNIEFRFRRQGGETLTRIKSVSPGNQLFFSFEPEVVPLTPTPVRSPVPTSTTTAIFTAVPTPTQAGSRAFVPTSTDVFFGLPLGFNGTVTASGCPRDFSATIVYGDRSSGDSFRAFDVESNPSCTLWSPLFMNNADGWSSTVSLFNETARASTVDVHLKRLTTDNSEGGLLTSSFTLPPRAARILTAAELGAPDTFSGSLQLNACAIPENLTLGSLSANDLAQLARSAGEMTGVVFHDKAGQDRMETYMASLRDTTVDMFFPLVYNDYNGWTSRVVLFNTDRIQNPLLNRDITVTVKVFVTEAIDPAAPRNVEQSIIVRNASPREIDLTQLPKGVLSILLEAPERVQPLVSYVGTAYHLGPNGAAGAQRGQSAEARSDNQFDLARNFIPLLYRHAGFEDAWDSGIRVVKVGEGNVTPRITFYDRDSGEEIGPLSADRTLREGDAYTWYLPAIEGLRDGRIYSAKIEGAAREGDTQMLSIVHHFNRVRGLSSISSGVQLPSEAQFRNLDRTAPLVYKNVDGLSSGIQIQNLSGGDESASVHFRSPGGADIETVTVSLRPNGSATVYLPAVAALPDGYVGAAEITGTGPIGVEVNSVRYR